MSISYWLLVSNFKAYLIETGNILMRFIGVTLMLVAVMALLLPYAGAGFQFMQWSEAWGATTALAIKVGFAFVGFLLWRLGPRSRV